MKILMLTPYLPYPLITGGQTRSYNLIKRLSQLGHEITLFCLVKKEQERQYTPKLEKFCKEVRVFKRSEKPWTFSNVLRTGFSAFPFLVIRNWADGEKEAIEKKLAEEKFDLIHAETFYVMPHIPKTNIPIVLVDQTIEYKVYEHYVKNFKFFPLRPLLFIDVAKMKFWELKYWESAKKVLAMSEEDQKIMKSQIKTLDVEIVPNGVDCEEFGKVKFQKNQDPTVLYLGNFTWLQNREAVEILYKKVWPKIKEKIPNAKLWIIGKDAPQFYKNLKSKDVRVEEVEDVREAYQGAWVLVAPIYGSGGTRYKNFEAFASGLPVVTTSIGIGGTDAADGVNVLIRDDPGEVAKAAIQVIEDEKLRINLSSSAKEMVRKKYDWTSITDRLNKIYLEVSQNA